MSSQDLDVDVDVNVVSSPEPSPRGNTSDDEGRSEKNDSIYQIRHSSQMSSPITSSPASLAVSLLTTTAAASQLSPTTFHNLHSAHLLNSQYHNHLNNNSNHINSETSRLSPPKTPPETNNNSISSKSATTPTSGYTSFSISSILSRNDSPTSKKNQIISPLPMLPLTNGTAPQDAAMLTR
jgi:hypothetical protein